MSAPVVFGLTSCLWLDRLSVSVPVVLATAVKDVLPQVKIKKGSWPNEMYLLFYYNHYVIGFIDLVVILAERKTFGIGVSEDVLASSRDNSTCDG